jgi:hypothetical protein
VVRYFAKMGGGGGLPAECHCLCCVSICVLGCEPCPLGAL